ncbi:MAG: hypothetical protein OEW15_04355 [Nitrospirota bacterium]|nr:hypothetical protein [Nitrospirota bacterium]
MSSEDLADYREEQPRAVDVPDQPELPVPTMRLRSRKRVQKK